MSTNLRSKIFLDNQSVSPAQLYLVPRLLSPVPSDSEPNTEDCPPVADLFFPRHLHHVETPRFNLGFCRVVSAPADLPPRTLSESQGGLLAWSPFNLPDPNHTFLLQSLDALGSNNSECETEADEAIRGIEELGIDVNASVEAFWSDDGSSGDEDWIEEHLTQQTTASNEEDTDSSEEMDCSDILSSQRSSSEEIEGSGYCADDSSSDASYSDLVPKEWKGTSPIKPSILNAFRLFSLTGSAEVPHHRPSPQKSDQVEQWRDHVHPEDLLSPKDVTLPSLNEALALKDESMHLPPIQSQP